MLALAGLALAAAATWANPWTSAGPSPVRSADYLRRPLTWILASESQLAKDRYILPLRPGPFRWTQPRKPRRFRTRSTDGWVDASAWPSRFA